MSLFVENLVLYDEVIIWILWILIVRLLKMVERTSLLYSPAACNVSFEAEFKA